MSGPAYRVTKRGEGPLVATAVHNGHELRDEIAAAMVLEKTVRLREEDPHTGRWTAVGDTAIVVERSRFEFDLNRPRETCIYLQPEDSWGLQVWRGELPVEVIGRSLEEYDDFYRDLHDLFSGLQERHGFFVVYDLHSYNHLRSGAHGAPAEPQLNPEVNVGTGSLNRALWGSVVDRFIDDLRSFDFLGRTLDVRENVKFKGRQLARWTHENFPQAGCVLAVEFKKFFMNEWTGEVDENSLEAIAAALGATATGVVTEARAAAGSLRRGQRG